MSEADAMAVGMVLHVCLFAGVSLSAPSAASVLPACTVAPHYTSHLVPLREYQKLREDLHDMAVVAERRSEEPMSAAEMRRRLKQSYRLVRDDRRVLG